MTKNWHKNNLSLFPVIFLGTILHVFGSCTHLCHFYGPEQVLDVHISMCHMSDIPDMTWSQHGHNQDDSSHINVQIWPHPNIPAHIASSTILKQLDNTTTTSSSSTSKV